MADLKTKISGMVPSEPMGSKETRAHAERIVRRALLAFATLGADAGGDVVSENRLILMQQTRGWEGLYDEHGQPIPFSPAALNELIDRFPLAFMSFANKLKFGSADAEADARGSVEELAGEVREGNDGSRASSSGAMGPRTPSSPKRSRTASSRPRRSTASQTTVTSTESAGG
jgi:hypothetical protein